MAGASVREVVASLEAQYPGLAERLIDGDADRIRPEIAVAVDGEVSPAGLRQAVGPDSEIQFLPALAGG